jgi:hypothetical protein
MEKTILVDSRLKNKIETLMDCSHDNNECYLVAFKDLEDSFWFDNITDIYEFLNKQTVERFYDKELRKGYFDYINEYNETLRYYVQSNKGILTLIKEECIN